MDIENDPLRLALGLRSTAQSLGYLAIETGIFERLGLGVRIAAMETAAPAAVAGLIEGRFDLAEIGAIPVVEAVLGGHDLVIVAAPEPVNALFVLARGDIAGPAGLAGGRLGVLSAEGQTGVTARAMVERWGLARAVELTALGTYPRIYAAIAAGEIEAGVLSADWRFAGAAAHGMNALVDLGEAFGFQGPVIATSRRLITAAPNRVRAVVRGYIEAIHLFKTDRATVLPLLAEHLGFDDREAVAAAYEFYVPRFQELPQPSATGLQRIIDLFAERDPGARAMNAAGVCETGFLDEFAKDGLIGRLYGRPHPPSLGR